MPSLTVPARRRRRRWPVDGIDQAGDQALDESGCSSRKSVATIRWVVDELPVGPQVGLVDQHVSATLEDQAVAHGSGTQAPSMVAGLERGERVGVVLRAGSSRRRRRRCRSRSPAPPARPEARRPGCCPATASRASSREVVGRVDPSGTTSEAPPEVVPDTMRSASPSDCGKPLIAGLGPMNVTSMASAKAPRWPRCRR